MLLTVHKLFLITHINKVKALTQALMALRMHIVPPKRNYYYMVPKTSINVTIIRKLGYYYQVNC